MSTDLATAEGISSPELLRPHGKRGPRRQYLNPEQRAAFLQKLTEGFGRQLACSKLEIPFSRYRNLDRDSPLFRRQTRDAVEIGRQQIEELGHRMALANKDGMLAVQLARIDKARQLEQARRNYLAKQRAAALAGDPGEILTAITATAALFLPFVPAEQLPAILTKLKRHIDEVSGDGNLPAEGGAAPGQYPRVMPG